MNLEMDYYVKIIFNYAYTDTLQICFEKYARLYSDTYVDHISDDEMGEFRISFQSLFSYRSSAFISIGGNSSSSSSRSTLNASPTQSEYFSAAEDT